MTREEQIQQAEINYSVDTMFDGCDYIGQEAKQEAFIAGAKWADEHPEREMINKQEFITKVKRWLEIETDWNMEYDEEGRNPNYGKIDEFVKYLEA